MNEKKLQELISELRNGNDRQRWESSYKLSKSEDPAAVPALIQAYNDTDGSVRQNAINGLFAIGTQEALDFLNSQKEKMSEHIRIVIDGGELNKAADGKITMGSDPTMMTWLGIVFWGVLALGLLALEVKSILGGEGFEEISVYIAAFVFGYLAYDLYRRSQRGQVIIDPTSQKIKSRKREINFDSIKTIVANQTRLPFVIKVTFRALVTNGNPMILGSISGDWATVEKKSAQIMNLLTEKEFTVNFKSAI